MKVKINKENNEVIFSGFSSINSFFCCFIDRKNSLRKTIINCSSAEYFGQKRVYFKYGYYFLRKVFIYNKESFFKKLLIARSHKTPEIVIVYNKELEGEFLLELKKLETAS